MSCLLRQVPSLSAIEDSGKSNYDEERYTHQLQHRHKDSPTVAHASGLPTVGIYEPLVHLANITTTSVPKVGTEKWYGTEKRPKGPK